MTVEWETTAPVRTDAGMFALWQPEAFASVSEIDEWEDHVADEGALAGHVAAGTLVPVNIGVDGAFGFTVRIGRGTLLTEREARFVAVTSAAYRLVASGPVVLSGLEGIGSPPGKGVQVQTTAGEWSVVVQFIDWEGEPGMVDEDGDPHEGALSDFVLEVRPAAAGETYRLELETFVRPTEGDG